MGKSPPEKELVSPGSICRDLLYLPELALSNELAQKNRVFSEK